MRTGDGDVRHNVDETVSSASSAFGLVKERFLDEQNRMFLGEAAEELLRPLPDKSPAKMAEHDDAVAIALSPSADPSP